MAEALQTADHAYQQAAQSALAVHHAGRGVLAVSGPDRLDFLNRMSTQHLLDLPVPGMRQTVLTNALGRIVDWLEVIADQQRLLLLTSRGRAAAVKEWLEGYIFFQDQVAFDDASAAWSLWGCYGPAAAREIRQLNPDLPDDPLDGLTPISDGFAWPVRKPVEGVRLLLTGPTLALAAQRWPDAGPGSAAARGYQVLRVEAGLPEYGAEIGDEVTPLDVGLDSAVHFNKGCYIGQEVIARMESRQERRRVLRRLSLAAEAAAGAALQQGDRTVGRLTSVAHSPQAGWVGLALLRPRLIDPTDPMVRVGEEGVAATLLPPDPSQPPG